MAALLTYRSRNSFESRFGRKVMDQPTFSSAREPASPAEAHHQIHNDGHRNTRGHISRSSSIDSTGSLLVASANALAAVVEIGDSVPAVLATTNGNGLQSEPSTTTDGTNTPLSSSSSATNTTTGATKGIQPISVTIQKNKSQKPTVFSAQNYLRYQGDKFIHRFDANCYIAITRKMDVHDVSAGRGELLDVLDNIRQPSLVIGKA